LVLISLVFAYRQLNLLRLDVNLRNERAAKEKAINACERYLDAYVQKSGVFFDECFDKKILGYDGPVGDFTYSSLPEKLRDKATQRFCLDSVLPALNELEAIAASFQTGVADERTGFQIIGRSFCSTVQHHYDVISFGRERQAHNYWDGIVGLYTIWRPRLTKAEMEYSKNLLQRKIDLVRDREIRPIGVD